MLLEPTSIAGCMIVDLERYDDSRGFFARIWCQEEFAAEELPAQIVQSSISYNHKAGTLRGMHFQRPPSCEGKLVRCLRGAIVDVAIDLRAPSTSFMEHVAITLDDQNRRGIFIPPGCAHGFQTLQDETEVLYMMTDSYAPELAEGLRWNDPAFGIEWPISAPIMADRDARYPDFDESRIRTMDWSDCRPSDR